MCINGWTNASLFTVKIYGKYLKAQIWIYIVQNYKCIFIYLDIILTISLGAHQFYFCSVQKCFQSVLSTSSFSICFERYTLIISARKTTLHFPRTPNTNCFVIFQRKLSLRKPPTLSLMTTIQKGYSGLTQTLTLSWPIRELYENYFSVMYLLKWKHSQNTHQSFIFFNVKLIITTS
jgi:hypothetical protein